MERFVPQQGHQAEQGGHADTIVPQAGAVNETLLVAQGQVRFGSKDGVAVGRNQQSGQRRIASRQPPVDIEYLVNVYVLQVKRAELVLDIGGARGFGECGTGDLLQGFGLLDGEAGNLRQIIPGKGLIIILDAISYSGIHRLAPL